MPQRVMGEHSTRRLRWLLAACLAVLAVATIHAGPAAPLSALYRPTFIWRDRSVTAGRGFLVRYGGIFHERTLFLSCFHVLGDRPQGVLGFAGVSAEARPRMITSLRPLEIRAQAVSTGRCAQGELSVFEIDELPRRTTRLRLTDRPVQRGETVYLFSQAFGDTSVRLYRARVSKAGRTCLDYVFDDDAIELGGTSGSPVLDERGQVVGINVAGYALGDHLHGIANPAANILATLKEALADRGN